MARARSVVAAAHSMASSIVRPVLTAMAPGTPLTMVRRCHWKT